MLKLASIIDAGTLLGNGPGTATIGARYFGPIWELTENYFANAYYELGPFGLVAIALVVLTAPMVTLRAWRAEQDSFFRTALAAMVVYQAAIIVIFNRIFTARVSTQRSVLLDECQIAASRLAVATPARRGRPDGQPTPSAIPRSTAVRA